MANWRLEIGDWSISNLQSLWFSWRWFVGVSVLLVGLTAVPILLGYSQTPPNRVYTGLVMNPEDSQSYLAKMRQGAAGAWSYTVPFTPEPHEPVFVGMFYLVLGHGARWLGWEITAVYHLAQLFFAFLLFLTTAWFITLFFPKEMGRGRTQTNADESAKSLIFPPDRVPLFVESPSEQQKTAFLLAATGSGLGWLLFLLGQPYWLGVFPVDFKQPESHLFFTALTFPHAALGTAALLVYVGNLVGWEEKRPFSFVLIGSIAAITLGIVQPFLIFVPIGLTLLLGLGQVVNTDGEKHGFSLSVFFFICVKKVWLLIAPLVIAAPLFAYYGWVLQTNPVFRAWDAQALTPLAPWPHYVVSYGVWLALALLGWRRGKRPFPLLWLWLLTVLLLLLLPFKQPRRLIQGVDVALVVLATAALVQVVVPWLKQRHWFQWLAARPRYSEAGLLRLLRLGLVATMALSNLYVWGSMVVTAGWQQPDLLFRPKDEQLAVDWLRAETAVSDTVLGAYQTGNWVAAQAGNRVVLGHWAETVAVGEKETAVRQFFAPQTTDGQRQALLQQYAVRYVWHGPREQALGTFNPASVPYLHPTYHNDTITLYVVES